MEPPKTSKHLATAVARSILLRTFARIYENEFGVPLYFESSQHQTIFHSTAKESNFCVGLNEGDGCCTRCVLRDLPSPETLIPRTWCAPCRAGMQVTMVPIMAWDKLVARLISGHYFIDSETVEFAELPLELISGDGSDGTRRQSLKHDFKETKRIPGERHELMVRYLETCCALIGTDLIHILTDGDQAIQGLKEGPALDETKRRNPVFETEIRDDELATLSRLETARRHFLRTAGLDADIACVAKENGWANEDDFCRDFRQCFGETLSEHRKRVTGLWHTFSEILSISLREPVLSHSTD